MELKYTGRQIIAAVAQEPFVYGANTFCKLIPLFNHRDRFERTINPAEFYNDGEIWWRLAATTNPKSITPGTMMEITVQPSQDLNSTDPNKSMYQANFTAKEEPLNPSAGAELFTLPREAVKVFFRTKGCAELALPHCPAKEIYLHVEDDVYGPFAADAALVPLGQTEGKFKVHPCLSRNGIDLVYRLSHADFIQRYHILNAQIKVSLDERGCRLSNLLKSVSFNYLAPDECVAIAADRAEIWQELDWEPLAAKFARMAGTLTTFSRPKRQQLKGLIQELEDAIAAGSLEENFKEATQNLRRLSSDEEEALINLGVAVLNADIMNDPRHDKMLEKFRNQYLDEHRLELNDQLVDIMEKTKTLKKRVQDEQARFDRVREQHKADAKKEADRLKQQLDKMREAAQREIDAERKAWQSEQGKKSAELLERQRAVEATLEEIKNRTSKSAADCLTLYPFLKELMQTVAPKTADEEAAAPKRATEPFALPESIHVPSPNAKNVVAERAFLDRIRDYAGACGFSYDTNDIRRFHLSVLCEDITILEGPSGVGKSSLARLYGDVVAGASAAYPRTGTHIVHVNPSWMERADLLGYVNTVTAEFAPSETGLYQRLILADADFRRHAAGAAIYPICLDEMNLAQVEHYFSDFMQILEMPYEKRILPCFSQDAVSATAAFRDYATVSLAPTLRFIGTVNFDETTRRLSSRLLDRANLICLSDLPQSRTGISSFRADAGGGIAYGQFESWRKIAPLSAAVEKRLADLADPLRRLGVVVSPRVRAAMARYLATAQAFAAAKDDAENVAFDEQLAQRVLSKVRSITSVAQKKALDAVAEIVEGFRKADYSPAAAVIERLRAKEHFFGYENDPSAQ